MAGNNVKLLSKVYFLWLCSGGGCKHPYTHQYNTCVTYTVFIWSFSTFSELYVVCIAYSMRCTKPSILFATEILSLSLLRVCASFERIISCKIRRCHFVSVFMHTAYTRTHTKNTNTNARVRHFLFGTKRIFASSLYRFDFDEFLINFENRHVQNGKLKRTKMFIFSLSISFTVLNSEIFSCLTFSILRDSKKDQRSK